MALKYVSGIILCTELLHGRLPVQRREPERRREGDEGVGGCGRRVLLDVTKGEKDVRRLNELISS